MRARAQALLSRWGRWYPIFAAGAAAVSAWGVTSLWLLRACVAGWAVSFALTYRSWQSAHRRAEQLRARGDRALPCATCHHYACDGESCASCEGACTAPRVTSMPRPSVPRPRADWLN